MLTMVTMINRTSACTWYNCKGCQQHDYGLEKLETRALAVHVDKCKLKSFLKKPSAYKARKLLNLSRNQLRIMKELLTGYSFIRSPIYTGTGKQSQV